MKPEGSLPCPQDAANSPDPEPDLRSILILSTNLRVMFSEWPRFIRFSNQNIVNFRLPYACYMNLPSPSLIWSP
jgi:hypothetical protein